MSEYTSQELEIMLAEQLFKEEQQATADFTSSAAYLFEQDFTTTIKSIDYEFNVYTSSDNFKTPIIKVHESETQNKQFIETPFYWNETRDGDIVARARVSSSYTSGSYGSSYTIPNLQILGTREKDLTIFKG
tara:strand:- start:3100 stop:3495 length:396 start_codon:yes stop_codon:yes gene_type:complete